MGEAFAQCAMAMYGYMTEIDYVEELTDLTIEASGMIVALYYCSQS